MSKNTIRKLARDNPENALFKLAMQAKKEIADGKGMTPEDVLRRLRAAGN